MLVHLGGALVDDDGGGFVVGGNGLNEKLTGNFVVTAGGVPGGGPPLGGVFLVLSAGFVGPPGLKGFAGFAGFAEGVTFGVTFGPLGEFTGFKETVTPVEDPSGGVVFFSGLDPPDGILDGPGFGGFVPPVDGFGGGTPGEKFTSVGGGDLPHRWGGGRPGWFRPGKLFLVGGVSLSPGGFPGRA